MKRSSTLAISGLLCAALQGAAHGSSLFEEGIGQFKSGQYAVSVKTLSTVVTNQPGSQLGRYYLACALVKVHEHRRAVQEYRVAYLLDPASTTGEYCRKALNAYKASLPDEQESQRVKEEIQRQSRQTASGDQSEMARTLTGIRRQTDSEKNKYRSDEQNREGVIRKLADEQLRQIDQQAAEQIARLSDPIVFTADGARANPLLIYPDLLKQREDAIKKSAQEEKERILRALDEKTERYKGIQKTRDTALDEVAANLETQMKNGSRSGVRLQASGTGLYVRNYLPSGTRPPEAKQAVVRIVDQSNPPPTRVDDETSSPNGSRSVTGTIRQSPPAPLPVERMVNGKLMLPH